jgi:hypothetical protein
VISVKANIAADASRGRTNASEVRAPSSRWGRCADGKAKAKPAPVATEHRPAYRSLAASHAGLRSRLGTNTTEAEMTPRSAA